MKKWVSVRVCLLLLFLSSLLMPIKSCTTISNGITKTDYFYITNLLDQFSFRNSLAIFLLLSYVVLFVMHVSRRNVSSKSRHAFLDFYANSAILFGAIYTMELFAGRMTGGNGRNEYGYYLLLIFVLATAMHSQWVGRVKVSYIALTTLPLGFLLVNLVTIFFWSTESFQKTVEIILTSHEMRGQIGSILIGGLGLDTPYPYAWVASVLIINYFGQSSTDIQQGSVRLWTGAVMLVLISISFFGLWSDFQRKREYLADVENRQNDKETIQTGVAEKIAEDQKWENSEEKKMSEETEKEIKKIKRQHAERGLLKGTYTSCEDLEEQRSIVEENNKLLDRDFSALKYELNEFDSQAQLRRARVNQYDRSSVDEFNEYITRNKAINSAKLKDYEDRRWKNFTASMNVETTYSKKCTNNSLQKSAE